MLESKFKTKLKKEIEERLPGCMIVPGDASSIQGLPDLIILYKKRWAALEGKRASNSPTRPNQPYYVDKMNKMSFAAFISPENKSEVLDDLQHALQPRRTACVSVGVKIPLD